MKKFIKKILVIFLVFNWLLTGSPALPYLNFLPKVEEAKAAVGDIGHWRDTVGGQIATQLNFVAFDFDSEIRNDGIYSRPDDSTIEIDEAGSYLIIASLRGNDTSNGRNNIQSRVALTSGTGTLFTSYYTGYSRDTSEDEYWTRAVGVLINGSADANIQIQIRRDSDAPTGGSVANASDIQIVRINPDNYGVYALGDTSALGGTTPNTVDLTAVTSESSTSAIEGNTSTDAVTVKGDNKRYLLAWSVSGTNNSPNRTQRIGHLEYDGSDDLATRSYCMGRTSSVEYCGLGSMDILETSTSDRAIQVEVYLGDGVSADQGGADSDASFVADGNGQLVVLELPDTVEVFRSHDSTGLQDITSAVTLNAMETVDFNDSASFTKASNTAMDVTAASDVFAWANVWTARNDISSGSRLTAYGSITVNGVEQSIGEHGNYTRGNQGSTDTFGGSFHPAGIYAVGTAGHDIGVNMDPLSGSEAEGASTDRTQPGTVGFFAINLDTLDGGGGGTPDVDQIHYRWRNDDGDESAGVTDSISVRVSDGNDDAEERIDTGAIDITSSDLELTNEEFFGTQVTGLRFQNITVPQGATISNAYVQFHVDETTSGDTDLVFHGEDIDDAPAFTTTTNDVTNRTTTTASVNWDNVPAWNSVDAEGADQRSPDISTIIQEIVDRGGWSSGNDMVIIVSGTGQRIAESYDGESGAAPLLTFDYSTGSGAATWAANEDTELTDVPKETTYRVRFELSNEGTASNGGATHQLQVAEAATCSAGSYSAVPTDTSGHWQISASTYLTDGDPTTDVSGGLTNESTTFMAGETKDTGNTTGSITLGTDQFTEIEFSVEATTNATDGGHYCFRLSNADTYTVYAEATLEAGSESTFTQNAYRWYVDNDSTNPTEAWGTPDIAENTSISMLPPGNDPPSSTHELRLRVNITVGTGDLSSSSQQFKLQFKQGTDGSCTTGSWTDVGASQAWEFASSSVSDGAVVTGVLSSTDVNGQYAKSNPTAINTNGATVGQDVEYDFHIIGANIDGATRYSFRVIESDNTTFTAYTNCPTLTTEPTTDQLLRHGNVFSDGIEQGFYWAD